MSTALIGLGSNLGDRAGNLNSALDRLRNTCGIETVVASSFHASKPIGGPGGQPEFLNAAARVETSLSPHELLFGLQRIEYDLGRVRTDRWGSRTIDLDILLFDDAALDLPYLTLPHPRFAFRRFALKPAAEVAPNMMHVWLRRTVAELVTHWQTAARYVAIAGPSAGEYSQIVAEQFDARLIQSPFSKHPAYLETEWLNRAIDDGVQRIAKSSWPNDKRLAVSNFWLFEWHLGTWPTYFVKPREPAEWNRRGAQFIQDCVSPRLVVMTQKGSDPSALRQRSLVAFEWFKPVLCLDTSDRTSARAEIFAAIEASS